MSRIIKGLLVALVGWTSLVSAQEVPGTGFDKVRIARPEETIQAELHAVKSTPEMRADADYFWYSGNSIHTTRGGYSGRLLDGLYSSYYLNKNLKALGHYKAGLKEGLWRSWLENGILVSSYYWEKGMLNGEFAIYDEYGQATQTGSYHDGTLNGWLTSYAGGKTQKTYYRKGKAASYVSFWRRLNIFKRK